jgi:cobalt-zinc-cadmium efflux system outer membrane protein
LRQTVEHRTRAGELAKADLARANLEEATATIAVAARRREVQAALGAVRSWCGGGLPATFTISDALPEAPPEIALDEVLRQAQERHPRLRLLAAQVGQRSAEMQRERDAWQPDLTLGISADRAADTDDLGVSLGLDLPLWDRGSGAMAAAEAERSRASAALRAERQALERAVLGAWNAYESARLELAALSTQALPVAEDAVRLRQAAYAAGEDSLADLLESKRAAQDVADAILSARRAAAEAGIALGRAVGSFTTSQEPQP